MKENINIKFVFYIIIILSFIFIIIVNNSNSLNKESTLEEDISSIKKITDRTKDPNALLELGLSYSMNKQNDKAIETYLSIIDKYPENTMAWHRLGLVYVETEKFEEALYARTKVATIDVTQASSYYYYSLILFMFDPDEAIIMGDKYIKLAQVENTVSEESIRKFQQMIRGFEENYNKGEMLLAYKSLLDSDIFYNEYLKIGIIDKLLKEGNLNKVEVNELKQTKTRIEKTLIDLIN